MPAKKRAAAAKRTKPERPTKSKHGTPAERAALADRIIDLIANHKHGTGKACAAVGVVQSSFMNWVAEDVNGLRNRYIEAREQYFESLAEECLEIADDGTNDFVMTKAGPMLRGEHVQRSALRISTRKWLCEVGARPRTGYGLDKEEADAEASTLAVAALERIAAAKVSRAA